MGDHPGFMIQDKQLAPEVLVQCYRTAELRYLLSSPPMASFWKNVDYRTYQVVALAGTCSRIERPIIDEVQYFCPIIHSPFLNNDCKLFIPDKYYKDHFVKSFNKLFKRQSSTLVSNSNSNVVLTSIIVANVVPMYLEDSLVFTVSSKTYIIALPDEKYLRDLGIISTTFAQKYSRIGLVEVMSNLEVDIYKEAGISIEDLQKRLNMERKQDRKTHDICGVVKIKHQSTQSFERKKCRTISLNLYQSEIKQGVPAIGVYSVKLLYYLEQEEEIRSKVRNWSTLIFKNANRVLQNDGDFVYYVQDCDDIVVVDNKPWRYANLLRKVFLENLCYSDFDVLKKPAIIRNIMKFLVCLVRVECIKISLECPTCFQSIRSQVCDICNNDAKFDIWTYCEVQDSSSVGYLHMSVQESIKFFDLTQEDLNQLKAFCVTCGGQSVITGKTDIDVGVINRLLYKMKVEMIEKIVVGYPYVDKRRTFKVRGSESQGDMESAGIQKKVNVNGVIEKKGNIQFWAAAVKVEEVYDVEY